MTNETTKVMTTTEVMTWLKNFYIGNNDCWKCIYTDALTAIYNWNLDNDVEVVTTIEVDTTVLITVNFYEDAYSGTPYRTGTVRVTV